MYGIFAAPKKQKNGIQFSRYDVLHAPPQGGLKHIVQTRQNIFRTPPQEGFFIFQHMNNTTPHPFVLATSRSLAVNEPIMSMPMVMHMCMHMCMCMCCSHFTGLNFLDT
jgi:hypothetical protein